MFDDEMDQRSFRRWKDLVEQRLRAGEKNSETVFNHLKTQETAMQRQRFMEAAQAPGENLDRALAYNNVVLTVGYAGFFALWSIVKEMEWPRTHAVAGLLIAFSLVFFVGWEVLRMYLQANYLRGKIQDREAGKFDNLRDGEIRKDPTGWLMMVWPYVFYITVGFGVVGIGMMLWVLVARAICAVFP